MSLRLSTSTSAAVFVAALGALAVISPIAAKAGTIGHAEMSRLAPGAFSFGSAGTAAEVDRTIKLSAHDISYDVKALNVKAGETVRFVITNKSEVDHDFTLGDAATQAEHREEMAEMGEMGGAAHKADVNAVFVRAGETKELIWKFGGATSIEFGCNVPGHYEAGMRGTIAVI